MLFKILKCFVSGGCNSIVHAWLKCQVILQTEMCMCLPCPISKSSLQVSLQLCLRLTIL